MVDFDWNNLAECLNEHGILYEHNENDTYTKFAKHM